MTEVVNDSTVTLKSYDVGAVKTWVHIPPQRSLERQEVAIKEAEWTSPMQLIEEHLNDVDCIMVQLMPDARRGMRRGESVKHAAALVEERKT